MNQNSYLYRLVMVGGWNSYDKKKNRVMKSLGADGKTGSGRWCARFCF